MKPKEIHLRIDPELWKRAKITARELPMSAAQLVELSLTEKLERISSRKDQDSVDAPTE